METTIKDKHNFHFSDKSKYIFFEFVSYLFILLFIYTASSKLFTVEEFSRLLIKYPLIGGAHEYIAYSIPIIELGTALLLIIPLTKKIGMFFSFLLMLVFLIYILFMFVSGSNLPCSCGGIVAKLTWQQHIWFNLIFMILALTSFCMKTEKSLHTIFRPYIFNKSKQ